MPTREAMSGVVAAIRAGAGLVDAAASVGVSVGVVLGWWSAGARCSTTATSPEAVALREFAREMENAAAAARRSGVVLPREDLQATVALHPNLPLAAADLVPAAPTPRRESHLPVEDVRAAAEDITCYRSGTPQRRAAELRFARLAAHLNSGGHSWDVIAAAAQMKPARVRHLTEQAGQ